MNKVSPKSILVVDDSGSVRREVGAALTAAGYIVVDADNGVTGLQRLEAHPGVCAVISDIHMPCMGGLEMLQSIKSHPEHAALPILILTSEVQQELIAQARQLGARAWLVKPVDAARLVATIKKLVSD